MSKTSNKRLIAALVAISVVIGFVAFNSFAKGSDPLDGFTTASYSAGSLTASDGKVEINLPLDKIYYNGRAATAEEVYNANIDLATTGKAFEYIETYQIEREGSRAYIALKLKTLDSSISNVDGEIGLRLNNQTQLGISNANEKTMWISFALSATKTTTGGNLTGFKSPAPTLELKTVSLKQGGSESFKIPSSIFEGTPNGTNVTVQELVDCGFLKVDNSTKSGYNFDKGGIGVSDPNFTVALDLMDKNEPKLVLYAYYTESGSTTKLNTPAKAYEEITINLRRSGFNNSPAVAVRVKPTVTSDGTALNSGDYIDGIDTAVPLEDILINGKELPSGESFDNFTVWPGDEVWVKFTTDNFTWKNKNGESIDKPATQQVPADLLSKAGITAMIKTGTDSKLVEIVREDNRDKSDFKTVAKTGTETGYTYFVVKFKEPYISTKATDFKIEVGFNKGRSTTSDRNSSSSRNTFAHSVMLQGRIDNEEVYVYSGDKEADISNNAVLVADSSVSNISLYLGDGVTITTSLKSGTSYYGYAYKGPDPWFMDEGVDEDIMDKYKDIADVYNLATMGLGGTGARVSLDDVNSSYHVYGGKGLTYLGTGSEIKKLPYYTKYYISSKKLNIGDDDTNGANNNNTVEEDPGDTPPSLLPPANGNYNPGTGC